MFHPNVSRHKGKVNSWIKDLIKHYLIAKSLRSMQK